MKKVCFLLFLFAAGSAHAAQFLRVTKNNSVVGYKEPTVQSKMLSVFLVGDEIEIISEKDGWYKVKMPYHQGYFILGWIAKNNPSTTIISRSGSSSTAAAIPSGVKAETAEEEDESEQKPKGGTGLERSESRDMDVGTEENKTILRAFTGAVYNLPGTSWGDPANVNNLHKYGAFQYKVGLAYEIPLSQTFKLGIPLSYSIGNEFNSIMFGVESMYSFFFSWFAITPRLGVGYEHLFGNGRSFEGVSTELSAAFEFSVADHFVVGIEPLGAQLMFWNSTDSLNKVPLNIRGESLILVRGHW
jgi:hypothetical protein